MPSCGLLEWFRPGDEARVAPFLADCAALGVTQVRTGVSWADYRQPGGAAFYGWLLTTLSAAVEVLPVVSYTPATAPHWRCNVPPADLCDYAIFLWELCAKWGHTFTTVELWNEPNNRAEWDETLDPGWHKLSALLAGAAGVLRLAGKRSVLGGLSPPDPVFLELLFQQGTMRDITHIGLHGFPGTWDGGTWPGWPAVITALQAVLDRHGHPGELWITETGYSTVAPTTDQAGIQEHAQVGMWQQVQQVAGVARCYWYGWQDLAPHLRSVADTVLGCYDPAEYHFGLRRSDGTPKPLYRAWKAARA